MATYHIDTKRSKATFTLSEVLMGKPNIVVGTSARIRGTITASLDQPAKAHIGIISVDATAFHTDSGARDEMIHLAILQSQQRLFHDITFDPMSIEGLPTEAVSVGATLALKIIGTLTIRDVPQMVTFETNVTVKSDTELDGVAKTTVTRAAFKLTIPQVPRVANVSDQVAMEFDFVAVKD